MAASAEVTYIRSQPESANTLDRIVDLVRRILRADVTSVVSFSLVDETITWKAASGFRAHVIDAQHPLVQPITNKLAQRALTAESLMILEGIGVRDELPASDFPVHTAEDIRVLALTPLQARGQILGALTAGYRSLHDFTADEKQLLGDLAEMAALALDNAQLLELVGAGKKIWEQTFDAIPEGILVHDARMGIMRCNAHAAEMMNLRPAEVIGLSCGDAFARLFGDRAAAFYMAESRGTASSFELQAENGKRYLVSIAPMEQSEGEPVSVVTWSDVTELSEIQEQLSRSRRLAMAGQLAAGVAHEINNPLAAITMCADATIRDFRKDSETQALAESHRWNYHLEEIIRQALRCKDITRGLLDLTTQREARRVMCDLNAIATQCTKIAAHQARSAAVEFEINLDEKIGEVATDAAMVRQILDSLLSNAIDALREKGGKVSVSTARDGDRVAVEVADTGHGIPADSVAKVFDPFFSTKRPGKGSGLGLATSLMLAESLGGALTVESKEGMGSSFRLWIPRRAPASNADDRSISDQRSPGVHA
jgi:two-component system NtrC family sensor kinase